MAGTIPLSMTQQFDIYGKPLSGAQLYIMQVGTVSTPQDAFVDTNLTIKMPYPMVLNAAGRVPQFFLADGFVKIRLQDKAGLTQLASDSVMVIGASTGGGGGSTVDQRQLIQPGMMMFAHQTSAIDGFVILNGKTIGSSLSSASQMKGAICQVLFQYLWSDFNLVVYAGASSVPRGPSALADWNADRHIATPDWRGCALTGIEDMGGAGFSSRLSSTYYGNNPGVIGNLGGEQSFVLTTTEMPSHSHPNTLTDSKHTHNIIGAGTNSLQAPAFGTSGSFVAPTGPGFQYRLIDTVNGGISADSQSSNISISNVAVGSGGAFRTFGPRRVVTFYMKL